MISYDGLDGVVRRIELDPDHPIRDRSAFNIEYGRDFVGDVRIVFELDYRAGDGELAWEYSRDTDAFNITLAASGACSLTQLTGAGEANQVVARGHVAPWAPGTPRTIACTHVDHRVALEVDGVEVLSSDGGSYEPNLARLRVRAVRPAARIALAARSVALELHGLRVERDVYYTFRAGDTQRAYAGRPFRLGADAYFMLGDNSRYSYDSREWRDVHPILLAHLRRCRGEAAAEALQIGVVPGDLIVGRASFVYLPGLIQADAPLRLRVPDIGRSRFVR